MGKTYSIGSTKGKHRNYTQIVQLIFCSVVYTVQDPILPYENRSKWLLPFQISTLDFNLSFSTLNPSNIFKQLNDFTNAMKNN
jgi:hypothetical protein